MDQNIRSEKLQNESSPNFSNFHPGVCPEFRSEFSPKFSGVFVLRFVGNGDQKKFTKNPRHFQCKIGGRKVRALLRKFVFLGS